VYRTLTVALTAGLLASPLVVPGVNDIVQKRIEVMLASGEGLIMGGTGQPTPTPGDVTASGNLMDQYGFTGTPQVLTTPESSFGPWTSGTTLNDVTPLVNEVNALEAQDPGAPIYAFGYSESADVQAGPEAAALKGDPGVHFFQVGNGDAPNGGYLTDNPLLASYYGVVPATPANLDGIPTDSICIGYEGWCDQPIYQGNAYATGEANAGESYYGHYLYYDLNTQELASAATTTDGSVTYIDVNNGGLPYLDPYILSSSGASDGRGGAETYDYYYAYYKVLADLGYGHVDTISNGQVIAPAANEFNTGDPGTVTSYSGAEWPSNVTQAQVNALLAQANTLDASNYSQMVNDSPSQLAAWDASGENPAYNAAVQLQSLLGAAVDNGQLTSAQATADNAAMFAAVGGTVQPLALSAQSTTLDLASTAAAIDPSEVTSSAASAIDPAAITAAVDPTPHVEGLLQMLLSLF
jgi:hypothetical protein